MPGLPERSVGGTGEERDAVQRRHELAWRGFAVAWLIWQLGLPLGELASPRPSTFGWQMFSGGEAQRFFVRRPDGSEMEISPLTVLAVPRPEIRAERALAAAFCAADPRAEAVRVQAGSGGPSHQLPCP
jgi:hypothetical protein